MPINPPAPPAFSIRICCLSGSVITEATTRASVSVGPPAAAGTTKITGLFGNSCANAPVARMRRQKTSARIAGLLFVVSAKADCRVALDLLDQRHFPLEVFARVFREIGGVVVGLVPDVVGRGGG